MYAKINIFQIARFCIMFNFFNVWIYSCNIAIKSRIQLVHHKIIMLYNLIYTKINTFQYRNILYYVHFRLFNI